MVVSIAHSLPSLLSFLSFTAVATLTWCLPLAYTVCRVDNAPAMQFIQFNCPDGQYNELATLLQAVPSTYGLKHTFHSGADAFTIQSLVIAGCVYLFVLLFLFGAKIVMGVSRSLSKSIYRLLQYILTIFSSPDFHPFTVRRILFWSSYCTLVGTQAFYICSCWCFSYAV